MNKKIKQLEENLIKQMYIKKQLEKKIQKQIDIQKMKKEKELQKKIKISYISEEIIKPGFLEPSMIFVGIIVKIKNKIYTIRGLNESDIVVFYTNVWLKNKFLFLISKSEKISIEILKNLFKMIIEDLKENGKISWWS